MYECRKEKRREEVREIEAPEAVSNDVALYSRVLCRYILLSIHIDISIHTVIQCWNLENVPSFSTRITCALREAFVTQESTGISKHCRRSQSSSSSSSAGGKTRIFASLPRAVSKDSKTLIRSPNASINLRDPPLAHHFSRLYTVCSSCSYLS